MRVAVERDLRGAYLVPPIESNDREHRKLLEQQKRLEKKDQSSFLENKASRTNQVSPKSFPNL